MNYLIVDGEGFTKKGNQPYELGYCIMNEEGETLIKRDFFFPKFMRQNAGATFASQNFDYYMERKDTGEYITCWTPEDFAKVFINDYKLHKPKAFLAWKASVDWNFVSSLIGEDKLILMFDRWYDISNGAANSSDYIKWCYDNDGLSEKGYPRFNVDTCLQYLYGETYRPEVHRGIEDCVDEANLAFHFGFADYEKWTTDAGQLWRRFK